MAKSRILYEMHVRGFTQDPASHVTQPGTFASLSEKLAYLTTLGVTTLELMPIFSFSHTYWGYAPQDFFRPHAPYGTAHDFFTLVETLHRHHFEVILDVVYNHTDGKLPHLTYTEANYSGCGDTLSCNAPDTMETILSSLRYWATEMGVDGFRFDLASILTRDLDGTPLAHPPLIERIDSDKALQGKLLIAEAWDCAGLYQVGSFPSPHWAEWNGRFRDTVRRFIKGDQGLEKDFLSAMLGSKALYHHRTPQHSINFITAHDGFTLHDLVSYNHKHNEANGEDNRDGSNDNHSWNCGFEGPTDNPAILSLRERQMRNFLLALFFAFGTPMLLMGDEYGHTRHGNNNPYNQDNALNYFLWDEKEKQARRVNFVQTLIQLRQSFSLFTLSQFPEPQHLIIQDRFVSYTVGNLLLAFNSSSSPITFSLPPGSWQRLIDTQFDEMPPVTLSQNYVLMPQTSIFCKKLN